ncbi:hypothetical protein FISHEDRAFT_62988 [Fistulina hepatica ATCC 64428]|uniref:Uncharacterized protein n=1 Tax=Fistulina hepatica ATCC 64428 TaxID=1128425 RepID=A0A0D6ZZT5_9AGAR|nr:hypothetical protein FISHEDRAFT_62988 [Fistulina hepatica ATCC 64428]
MGKRGNTAHTFIGMHHHGRRGEPDLESIRTIVRGKKRRCMKTAIVPEELTHHSQTLKLEHAFEIERDSERTLDGTRTCRSMPNRTVDDGDNKRDRRQRYHVWQVVSRAELEYEYYHLNQHNRNGEGRDRNWEQWGGSSERYSENDKKDDRNIGRMAAKTSVAAMNAKESENRYGCCIMIEVKDARHDKPTKKFVEESRNAESAGNAT